MRYLSPILVAAVISGAYCQVAEAQLQNDTNAGNISGQTGQSENFNIQRDTNAFIGGAATSIFGAQGGGAAGLGGVGNTGLLGGLGGLGGFGRGNTGFGAQANAQSTAEPRIRFRITLGFSHPRPTGAKVSAQFARRLSRIPQLPSARSVAVTMEERTAVLAGAVETERERRLIEKLAMMEPGVSAVRNELTVKADAALLPVPEGTN
ncbi:MAG: hypothetical protein CMJ64_16335 [Planctomycetaceae bacterium]|nr:hypothetical protein [Planctomycetaceae bacterium]